MRQLACARARCSCSPLAPSRSRVGTPMDSDAFHDLRHFLRRVFGTTGAVRLGLPLWWGAQPCLSCSRKIRGLRFLRDYDRLSLSLSPHLSRLPQRPTKNQISRAAMLDGLMYVGQFKRCCKNAFLQFPWSLLFHCASPRANCLLRVRVHTHSNRGLVAVPVQDFARGPRTLRRRESGSFNAIESGWHGFATPAYWARS